MSILNSDGTTVTALNHSVTSSLPIFRLGLLDIFSEQQLCALEIESKLKGNELWGTMHFPLLVAEPQQGKTNAMLLLIHLLRESWIKQKVQGVIVVLVNVSNNSLIQQTEKRIKDAGFSKKLVKCFHLMSKTNLNAIVALRNQRPNDRLVIINDEAHVAQKADGVFESLMLDLGVIYGVTLPKNVSVISVTATPYAHEVLARYNEDSTGNRGNFKYVKLDMNSNYFSLGRMFKKGRLAQSENVTEIKTFKVRNKEVSRLGLSDFMFSRLIDLKILCEDNLGYMLLRAATIVDARKIAELCVKEGVDCSIFSSYVDAFSNKPYDICTINELNDKLGIRPEKPHILIIIQAGRVGVTFSTTRYIRMVIDTPTSAGDTTVQSVGRNLGYDDRDYAHDMHLDNVHHKESDKYIVYCNMAHIEDAIKFYEDPRTSVVPSGTQNKTTSATGTVTRDAGKLLILKANNSKKAIKELYTMLNKPTVYAKLLALAPLDYGVHTEHRFKVTCGAVSHNISNPVAEDLSNFSTRANVTSRGKDKDSTGILRHVRIRHVDNCPIVDYDDHKNLKGLKGRRMSLDDLQTHHTKSWEQLMHRVPTIKGKFVYVLSDSEYDILTQMALLNNRDIKYVVLPKPANQPVVQRLVVSKKSTFQKIINLHIGTPALA